MAVEITSGDIFTAEQLAQHSKIYAGPGAGKTHFLVENVKNIIINHPPVAQSCARKVLCITYTNAAVDEIKRRLDRYNDSVEVYTIHGFIIEHIIKPFQQELRRIMEEEFGLSVSRKGKITSQVEGVGILHGVDKTKISEYVTDITSETGELGYSKKIMGDIQVNISEYIRDSAAFAQKTTVGKMLASSRINHSHILPIKEYVWSVVKRITHDEVLYFGYRILEMNHTALYAMRVRFPFIFIDEFQDTNPLQTKLIKLIGEKSTVISIIGDLAQSIYSFQDAKPSQFANFSINGDRNVAEYVINGNRRSPDNIVNFCNYLRQSDSSISQSSIKPYKDATERLHTRAKKVHFIIGEGAKAKAFISSIVDDGGVVLTRTWAAAFSYIRGITSEQIAFLKGIYNSYYSSPIDIRRDIEEHNFVTWVRAFKFIFGLWHGYKTGSFIDVLKAFSLQAKIDSKKITPKFVSQMKRLSGSVFEELDENTTEKTAVSVIDGFNIKVSEPQYSEILAALGTNFAVSVFDEEDRDELRTNVSCLNWQTSYKLFTEVFSTGSKYMTVHQAKGLEWKKVVVSLEPNSRKDRDNTTLTAMFSTPLLLAEESSQEFTRMYYVACSRAMEDLYIHLPADCNWSAIELAVHTFAVKYGQKIEFEVL